MTQIKYQLFQTIFMMKNKEAIKIIFINIINKLKYNLIIYVVFKYYVNII